jgi:hypothetical protein
MSDIKGYYIDNTSEPIDITIKTDTDDLVLTIRDGKLYNAKNQLLKIETVDKYETRTKHGYTSNYKNDKLHSDNDEPSTVSSTIKEWHKDGSRHRDNDLPAVICDDANKYWYKDDQLHRDNDLPAIQHYKSSNFTAFSQYTDYTYTERWCVNNALHRDDPTRPVVINYDETMKITSMVFKRNDVYTELKAC